MIYLTYYVTKDLTIASSLYTTTPSLLSAYDMVTKMKKLGFEMYSVPITYDMREGESKIQSVSDGLRILFTFFINLSWRPGKKNNKETSLNPYLGLENSL